VKVEVDKVGPSIPHQKIGFAAVDRIPNFAPIWPIALKIY